MEKNNTLAFDLLDIVKTKEDKQQFLRQLGQLSADFFTQQNDMHSLLEQSIPYGKKEKILHLAQKYQIDITNTATMATFITEIQTLVTSLPEVSIKIAFEPTQTMIGTLSTWCVVHLKKPMILDISVDKMLIGGAIFEYKGLYKDFSLKRKLNDLYEKGALRLLEAL
jgi:F0F1-type ATP synthase delta subunit